MDCHTSACDCIFCTHPHAEACTYCRSAARHLRSAGLTSLMHVLVDSKTWLLPAEHLQVSVSCQQQRFLCFDSLGPFCNIPTYAMPYSSVAVSTSQWYFYILQNVHVGSALLCCHFNYDDMRSVIATMVWWILHELGSLQVFWVARAHSGHIITCTTFKDW